MKKISEEKEKRIVKLYTEDEITQRQVAMRVGVHVSVVGEVLKRNNVQPNKSKRLL